MKNIPTHELLCQLKGSILFLLHKLPSRCL